MGIKFFYGSPPTVCNICGRKSPKYWTPYDKKLPYHVEVKANGRLVFTKSCDPCKAKAVRKEAAKRAKRKATVEAGTHIGCPHCNRQVVTFSINPLTNEKCGSCDGCIAAAHNYKTGTRNATVAVVPGTSLQHCASGCSVRWFAKLTRHSSSHRRP